MCDMGKYAEGWDMAVTWTLMADCSCREVMTGIIDPSSDCSVVEQKEPEVGTGDSDSTREKYAEQIRDEYHAF